MSLLRTSINDSGVNSAYSRILYEIPSPGNYPIHRPLNGMQISTLLLLKPVLEINIFFICQILKGKLVPVDVIQLQH
jgi:hypothetical protein